jgi:hypothetical protein
VDLVSALRSKIETLEDGEHTPGLKAVLLHIETSFRHFARGQDSEDETAFTDAIYRTNQAFEGSIKEAYRVLAGKDPNKVRPFDIENYLETNNIFRPRVLTQFTTYRTEWRNPSTHDYKLDFDGSEAFLAIITVSAFACLLLDQISERLEFVKSKLETDANKIDLQRRLSGSGQDLLARVVDIISEFFLHHMIGEYQQRTESQTIGGLSGFISSVAPDLRVASEERLLSERPFLADLVIANHDERVVVELKGSRFMRKNFHNAIAQVEHYMLLGEIKSAILVFVPHVPGDLETREHAVPAIDGKIVIVQPKNA